MKTSFRAGRGSGFGVKERIGATGTRQDHASGWCDCGRARVLPIGLATRRLPGEPTVRERIHALRRSRLSPAQLADLAYFDNRASIPSEAAAPAGTSKVERPSIINV